MGIWALILPGAVSAYNVILMLNFFRNLPRDLSEAFYVDGANHHHVLWRLYLPISMPSVATILLFTMVAHWNEWFNGLILMNHTENYPLATYLYLPARRVICRSLVCFDTTDACSRRVASGPEGR